MIKSIWRLTTGFRKRMALCVLAGVVRVVTGLLFVALSKRAVDLATGDGSGNLSVCIIGLIAVLVVEILCQALGNRTAELSEADMKNRLQASLFSRLMSAVWSGQEKFHSGELLSRLTEDCRVAAECICRTFPAVLTAILQCAGAFVFLWYFNPLLAIIVVMILPAFILAGKIFFRKMTLFTRQIRDIESRLQEKMQESLQHRVLLMTCRYTICLLYPSDAADD